jgi:hypothetical protein
LVFAFVAASSGSSHRAAVASGVGFVATVFRPPAFAVGSQSLYVVDLATLSKLSEFAIVTTL